jgi:hypothetical protein
VNTDIRNHSTRELRQLAEGTGPVAECAARILAEREGASARLAEICREVARERDGGAQ